MEPRNTRNTLKKHKHLSAVPNDIAQPPFSDESSQWRVTLAALLFAWFACFAVPPADAAGRYFEVSYSPSTQTNELQLGVTYRLWIPDGAKTLRGVIVHQHGCGVGACKGGETAAYDLHWQALAGKWDCALLGPSYHQGEKDNCRLWCDPRNGSHKTFLRALGDFAAQSRRPELARVPWCLWGHSGGGFWASLMQTMYPERIVAIWFRSGTAFTTWEKGEIPKPEIPAAALQVPMMCNPGVKERDHERFKGAWVGLMEMFRAYRAQGAPIGFAPDPRTSHECGDSRYLAIPFFDACLAMRLPDKGSADQRLKPVDLKQAWFATLLGEEAQPAAKFSGKTDEAVWLPNARVAKAWVEYVITGEVADTTPPPAPTNVKAAAKADGTVEITWDAEADFESGIAAFIIQRDGKDVARVPEKPVGKFGKPLFQTMSYHDTPEKPLPEMRFTVGQTLLSGPRENGRTGGGQTRVSGLRAGEKREYRVITVNSAGLKSQPSKPARVR